MECQESEICPFGGVRIKPVGVLGFWAELCIPHLTHPTLALVALSQGGIRFQSSWQGQRNGNSRASPRSFSFLFFSFLACESTQLITEIHLSDMNPHVPSESTLHIEIHLCLFRHINTFLDSRNSLFFRTFPCDMSF